MNGHQEDEHSAHEEEEEEKREMEEEEEEAALAEQCKEEGDVAYRNGQYKNAVLSYSRALDADPTYLTAFCNRAAAQMMLGEYDRAIDDCQAALNVDNSFAKAHLRLAKAYRSKGNFADALISYTKAQIYDRDSQTAQTEKAETEELRDTWGAARKTFETRNFARSLTLLGRLEGKCDGFYEMKVLHLRALVENHQFEAAVEYGKAQLGKLQRLLQNHQHIAAISQIFSLLG
jgi:tetratricopeptide (TPR) repeat protein